MQRRSAPTGTGGSPRDIGHCPASIDRSMESSRASWPSFLEQARASRSKVRTTNKSAAGYSSHSSTSHPAASALARPCGPRRIKTALGFGDGWMGGGCTLKKARISEAALTSTAPPRSRPLGLSTLSTSTSTGFPTTVYRRFILCAVCSTRSREWLRNIHFVVATLVAADVLPPPWRPPPLCSPLHALLTARQTISPTSTSQ